MERDPEQATLWPGESPSLSGGEPAHSPAAGRVSVRAVPRAPRRIPSADGLVAVPYVGGMLWRAVMGACERQAQQVFSYRLDPTDTTAYARLLVELWPVPKTLFVVEQDVIPPAGALPRMQRCPETWCTVPYSVGNGPAAGMLGCAKFGVRLRRTHPGFIREALRLATRPGEWCPWTQCDTRLAMLLQAHGYRPHVHNPPAVHLHPYVQR